MNFIWGSEAGGEATVEVLVLDSEEGVDAMDIIIGDATWDNVRQMVGEKARTTESKRSELGYERWKPWTGDAATDRCLCQSQNTAVCKMNARRSDMQFELRTRGKIEKMREMLAGCVRHEYCTSFALQCCL